MHKRILCSLLIGAALFSSGASAAEDKTLDPLIERLEKSGKLEAAVERIIERRIRLEREKQVLAQKAEQEQRQALAKNVQPVDVKQDHIYGALDAPISLIVFTDLECPYCQQLGSTPQQVADNSQGKVNVIFRHFPLPFHMPMAGIEAAASECVAIQAGSKGFYRFFMTVLAKSQLNGKGLPGGAQELAQIAKDSGATDTEAFKQCSQHPGVAYDRVEANAKDGKASGVTGTPTVIVHHNKLGRSVGMVGAATPEMYNEVILDVEKNPSK